MYTHRTKSHVFHFINKQMTDTLLRCVYAKQELMHCNEQSACWTETQQCKGFARHLQHLQQPPTCDDCSQCVTNTEKFDI